MEDTDVNLNLRHPRFLFCCLAGIGMTLLCWAKVSGTTAIGTRILTGLVFWTIAWILFDLDD